MVFENKNAAIKYVQEVLKFTTGMGKTGSFGVFVSSMPMGASYEYDEGVEETSGTN